MTERTTLRLNDDRKRKIDRAREIVAADEYDDPPTSDVIDAALTHLVESKANIDEAREDHDPRTIQEIANTSVLGLHYRTEIRDKWR